MQNPPLDGMKVSARSPKGMPRTTVPRANAAGGLRGRVASGRRTRTAAAQAHAVVLAYLAVCLVLGVIALIRASQSDIPEVILYLRGFLRM